MTRNEIMPIELQIAVIRRIVNTLNPELSDPDVIPISEIEDELWQDHIDSSASLPENIANLERRFPHIRWRAPKKEPTIKREQQEWTVEIDHKNEVAVHSKEVTIRPHRVTTKGKKYPHGRVQLPVPEKWIGQKAKISISVPYHLAIKPNEIYAEI